MHYQIWLKRSQSSKSVVCCMLAQARPMMVIISLVISCSRGYNLLCMQLHVVCSQEASLCVVLCYTQSNELLSSVPLRLDYIFRFAVLKEVQQSSSPVLVVQSNFYRLPYHTVILNCSNMAYSKQGSQNTLSKSAVLSERF